MNRDFGFTLIEVMIASVILFVSLGLVTLAYNHTISTNLRIVRNYQIAEALPTIRNMIEEQMRVNPNLQEGEVQPSNHLIAFWRLVDEETTNTKPWVDVETKASDFGGFDLALKRVDVKIYEQGNSEMLLKVISMKFIGWKKSD